MARCGCGSASCACSVVAGDGIVVTGNGTPGSPYTVAASEDADCPAVMDCVCDAVENGQGLDCNTNTLSVLPSTDLGNELVFGSDGRLYVGDSPGTSPDAIPQFQSLANSVTYDPGALVLATDHLIPAFAALNTRNYRIWLETSPFTTATSVWDAALFINDVASVRFFRHRFEAAGIGNAEGDQWSRLWQPASGTYKLQIWVARSAGTGPIQFAGAADNPRRFYVEDIGPR